MEMHHKLRRDPNWHPSACNICGQLYGDEAFRLKEPLYESDLLRMRKEKDVDLEALAKRAKEFAEMQANGGQAYAAPAAMLPGQPAALTNGAMQPPVKAEAPPVDGKPDLPPGWSTAKDQQGRTYYWHTKTKKVTWEKPTAETPIDK